MSVSFREREIERTLEEALESTVEGCIYYAAALVCTLLSGAFLAAHWPVTSFMLAVWACPWLFLAAVRWRSAAIDREMVRWLKGEAG